NTNTMGIVDVACFTVGAELEFVTIISALSRANSAANSAGRSGRPSVQRYSIATVRPSIQPSSRSRAAKAAVHGPQDVGSAPMSPPMGTLPAGCARAASGHTAAPPSSVMNSRLLTRSPRRRSLGGGRASAVPRGCRAREGVCAMLLLIAAIGTTRMACDEGRQAFTPPRGPFSLHLLVALVLGFVSGPPAGPLRDSCRWLGNNWQSGEPNT